MKRFLCAITLACSAGAGLLTAQLNENCVISVLNRTVQAKADGTWVIPNIPANFGRVRARATCTQDGITRSGESPFFLMDPNASVDIPPILLGPSTPIPTAVTLTAPSTPLTRTNPTAQITVNAAYANGATLNITAGSSGTTYNISNPALATISPNGLVTARGSGTVLVQALNEGTQGLLALTIRLTDDSDGDGIPDDVEIREGMNPRDPTDALTDFDNDGLTNRDEITRGTALRNPDTDSDTLTDGEEVRGTRGFVTNPLLADTDGDGVRDALEITSGSDPTNPASVNLGRALTRLEVAPQSFTLIVNPLSPLAYTQLRVLGRLQDNTTLDLTATQRGTNYQSSSVTTCNFGSPEGRVYAGDPGSCTITITNSGKSATVAGRVVSFTPRAVSQLSIPGYANNVDVANNYAFIAAGASGLQVVNVADPASPRIVGSLDTDGNANDVRVAGNFAYIADGANGLAIINIANPAAPVLAGRVDTPGEANDVYVTGNYAYVADGASGLVIINVTNPAAPIVTGSIDTPGTARGVSVAGELAVVADDGAPSLQVINVANPSNPRIVGSVALAGSPKDVEMSGSLAVVASYTGGMQIVSLTAPATPRVTGGLPGSAPNGFVPRDVALAGQFAIFAEQLFPNVVPFADISAPETPVLRGVIDFAPLGDYAGTGIAANGPFVYMTGENYLVGPENGTSGDTRLFIGQYLPQEDNAGVPPQVRLSSSAVGSTVVQGESLTVTAQATDDIAVTTVNFLVNGQVAFVDTSAPYEYTLTVPSNVSTLSLSATAVDLGENIGTASPLTLSVIPDPLTSVTGRVITVDGAGLAAATVTVNGDLSAQTGADGRFTIPGVPTITGNIIASATLTLASGEELTGSSNAVPAVRGGTTNVGTITAVTARWETNYGPCWSSADDTFTQRTLPFPFPFYGTPQTVVYVGTNGYVTFGSGDSTYTETIPAFSNRARISAFFDDLYGRGQGCTHINDTLPDRFVVTYDRVPHYGAGGSNTLQIVLYRDGRIQFGYRGITATATGSITGITPGPNAPAQQVNFQQERLVEAPAGAAIYEYFNSASPFDLDNSFVLFSPRVGGAYTVRTILPSPPGSDSLISGEASSTSAAQPSAARAATATNAYATSAVLTPEQLANAEVEITSSLDKRFRGMTNTDRRGKFSLNGVPRGGITVTVRRKGQLIGQGAAVLPKSAQKSLTVPIDTPVTTKKP